MIQNGHIKLEKKKKNTRKNKIEVIIGKYALFKKTITMYWGLLKCW